MLPIPLRAETGLESFPWATITLVAATAVASIAGFVAGPEALRPWILGFGELNPVQWVTAIFLHGGVLHLVGNLLFLWVFGLVVEGCAGGPKFLALYLIAGIAGSALEQCMTLNVSPADRRILHLPTGALGASGAIFGLVAAALLWAPRSRVEGVFFFGFMYRPFHASVLTYGLVYIGWELLGLSLADFRVSSAMAHILGAIAGWMTAWIMLKLRWVETGGWDLFSVGRRRRGW